MGDDAVAVVAEVPHLVFPVVAVQGPAVGEDDGRPGNVAPVFVVHGVAIGEREERHLLLGERGLR